jgi:hypothetical protein
MAIAAALAFNGPAASAAGLSLGSQEFSAVFAPLTMTGIEGGSAFSITCTVILKGSFESRTFSTRTPSEVGVINAATLGLCNAEGVRVSFLTETIPWSITYSSLTGNVAERASLEYELRGMRILVEAPPYLSCLYRSSQATPAKLTWTIEREVVTDANMNSASPIELLTVLREVFFSCPGALQLSGRVTTSPVLLLI